jgi:sugar fermentation stimulation protein A
MTDNTKNQMHARPNENRFINWPVLFPGTLVRRYQRFLADIVLDTGQLITAHCPNSGSMKTCCDPGQPVFVSLHDTPHRKLKYTWELIRMPDSLVGVNTAWPNQLVSRAIRSDFIGELVGYSHLYREVKVGEHSRLDILLTDGVNHRCFIEVKNCTMVIDGIAAFPDAITTRGQKHLVELQRLLESAVRCVMFFLIQRMDAKRFRPADEIDREYGKELRKAYTKGVEILVYDVAIDQEKIGINNRIPFQL